MAVTPSRTRHLLYFAQLRNCLPYAYGGAFSKDSHVSTDCSGLVFSAAALLVGLNPYQRYGSTETLRLARLNRVAAPCGLIPARDKNDVPANSALKVGVMHGGGGPDSHTACTFLTDGKAHNFESRGYPGVLLDQCNGEYARGWDNPLFTDFWYLPAAGGPDNPDFFPLPDGFYYGPKEGPDESISGQSGEPRVWLDRFQRWQGRAGVTPTGVYDTATALVAKKLQQAAGYPVTGLVDQKTWERVMGAPPKMADPLTNDEMREMLDGVRYIRDQLGPNKWGPDSSMGKTADGKELTVRDGLAAYIRKHP